MIRRLFFIIMGILICSGHLPAQDVALTVYNQNRALVREIRKLSIESGISTISFTDVAALIDPTSVHFQSLTDPDKLTILEQNFEYDLVSSSKILEKYIDESIRIVTSEGEVFSGNLLSAAGSDVVIQDQGGSIKVIGRSGIQHFDFLELPEGLITRPTLVWMVENQGKKEQDGEISYLTGGVNWHAEYVAVSDADDQNLNISGWVSVENRSGTAYQNAKLKLVAGDVNVVQEYRQTGEVMMETTALARVAPQFEESELFEYHLYTLQRRTTLKNNQIKQVSLFSPAQTKTKKLFIYDGARYDQKVRVHLEFQNSQRDGLGLPLPKGKIRVYKEDQDGALEFIGEDQIDHTPVDEKIRIFLGNAFDLVGERVVKSSRSISNRSREEEIEIVLRNHKEEDVEIVVVEHFYGDWNIEESSDPFSQKDAYTSEFVMPVPSQGERTLTYKVVIRW
ncbi:DUF4139 domain-containing protein [bacterium]|nr:DUF4139 domain-containing protein [bacterium]RQV92065.1 MAG: DUF4139 domain-containing protein [bacterium]